jgi:molecular chaperone GrpE (heat shock protein)
MLLCMLDNLMPLTPERRIELIMTQIGEMKKMYAQLKSKVSAIERLRKRHRREREGNQTYSCSVCARLILGKL